MAIQEFWEGRRSCQLAPPMKSSHTKNYFFWVLLAVSCLCQSVTAQNLKNLSRWEKFEWSSCNDFSKLHKNDWVYKTQGEVIWIIRWEGRRSKSINFQWRSGFQSYPFSSLSISQCFGSFFSTPHLVFRFLAHLITQPRQAAHKFHDKVINFLCTENPSPPFVVVCLRLLWAFSFSQVCRRRHKDKKCNCNKSSCMLLSFLFPSTSFLNNSVSFRLSALDAFAGRTIQDSSLGQ